MGKFDLHKDLSFQSPECRLVAKRLAIFRTVFSQIMIGDQETSHKFPGASRFWSTAVPRELAAVLKSAGSVGTAFFGRSDVDGIRLDILLLAAFLLHNGAPQPWSEARNVHTHVEVALRGPGTTATQFDHPGLDELLRNSN